MTEQPIGSHVDWTPAIAPGRTSIPGRFVTLEPIDAERHDKALWDAKGDDPALWTYLFDNPFDDFIGPNNLGIATIRVYNSDFKNVKIKMENDARIKLDNLLDMKKLFF